MSIVSFNFLLLIFGTLILYFLVPPKTQWVVLLVSSLAFYILSCGYGIIYIFLTTSTVYVSARLIENIRSKQEEYIKNNKSALSKEEKGIIKHKAQKMQKIVLILTLVFNFGLLCIFKYCHFAISTVNLFSGLFSFAPISDTINWIIPLGISFYTFQSAGYLVEVYWDNVSAQKNFAKMLLFVSFFPQIIQGPISDYEHLSNEMFKKIHYLDYKNYARGFQRLIWGYVKKILIANLLSPIVSDIFARYNELSGLTCLIGAFFYSIQIYADFSGYMDIMCGFCEMLGIKLTENFERPYFSKSVAEYWRRWHITLGAWFKNYIYYPIAVSKWSRGLGKKLSKRFNSNIGKNLPASIALVTVWLTTGLWHGASWAYIAWGGINGFFIIASLWLEPVFDKLKAILRINENSFWWKAFQTIRTFILVTIIKVLPEVGTLNDGIGLWKRVLFDFVGNDFLSVVSKNSKPIYLAIIVFLTAVLFIFSIIQRKKSVRDYLNCIPWIIRLSILAGVFVLIFVFGVDSIHEGGFMYAQF